MRKLTMTGALLAFAASGCSRLPEPQTASHPVAMDLTCLPEPQALTDDQVIADDASQAAGLGRPNEKLFNDLGLIAGRDCRDALHRTCKWHLERGDKEVDCDKPKSG